jgi:hypothetical protein
MTSARKKAANRRNAKKSTGPRSRAGKARSRGNATRHGLSVDISTRPDVAAWIAATAKHIAGPHRDDLHVLAAAHDIAAAQHQLLRVRRARLDLMADLDSHRAHYLPKLEYETKQLLYAALEERYAGDALKEVGTFRPFSTWPEERRAAFAVVVTRLTDPQTAFLRRLEAITSKLTKLERYEYRAFVQRAKATKRFDRLVAARQPHQGQVSVDANDNA